MSCSVPSHKIHPQPIEIDHFDALPDSIILIIFNLIADVKHLGRCTVVSKRFHHLIPQVESVFVRVDCVISDDSPHVASTTTTSVTIPSSTTSSTFKPRNPISSFFRLFMSKLFPSSSVRSEIEKSCVTHHSPSQVLKEFKEVKRLEIELPAGELGVETGVMLKWKATFGSTLDSCVILGASSVDYDHSYKPHQNNINTDNSDANDIDNDNSTDIGNIPESFYTNGGLKLRVVWTISSLIAASARHYLLQGIVKEHETLKELILTDSDKQGVLCMDKEQLKELRVKPLAASTASKRTLVPALNMKLWYAPELVVGNGMVMKGATLVAIRPSEGGREEVDGDEGRLVGEAFEEPFASAARMLATRRTYCLEMNSF